MSLLLPADDWSQRTRLARFFMAMALYAAKQAGRNQVDGEASGPWTTPLESLRSAAQNGCPVRISTLTPSGR